MKNISKHSVSDLKEFQVILEKKKQVALSQIEELNSQLDEFVNNGKDENSLENSRYDSQIESLVTYRGRARKHLADIEKALFRIKNGTYGVCFVTGELISKERLKAVPTTTKSLIAKMNNNQDS